MKKLAKIALVGILSYLMSFPVLADLDDGLVAYYPFDGDAKKKGARLDLIFNLGFLYKL